MAVASDLERDKTVTRALHRLFWKGMAHHRLSFSTVMFFQFPSFFIINILVPLQVAYGIQDIIHKDFDHVGHQAAVVLLTSLVGALFFAIGQAIYHVNETSGGEYVQRTIFANLLNKDYDFYSSRYIGSLGNDANDLRRSFQQYVLLSLFAVPRILVIVFLGLAVISYKSIELGIVTTVCLAVVFAVTMIGNIFRLKYRRQLSQANSELAGMMGDPLSHGPTVKSFAKEDYEIKRLEKPLRSWKRAQRTIYDTSIPITFVRHILLGAIFGILLLYSAYLYKNNEISVAVVALVQLYAIRIVSVIVEVSEVIKAYETLMSSAYEPMETMLVASSVNDKPDAKSLSKNKSYDITFDNVSYRYTDMRRDKQAVSNFTLTVKEGERIGLVGLSGGGKTTVTKLLLRFMDVDAGHIDLDGVNISDLKQQELREAIAYVPQEPLLFHRSIKENIAYAKPEASDRQLEKAAKIAFVDNFVKELPNGYDTMVGERGVKLSGGQRQRVAIARALLKDAPLLVLDEATSALDSESEKYIQKALWELMKGRTAIVIAHRLSTIQHMDRIVVMDKGKIVQNGAHNELLKDKDGIYARLWSHQSGGYLAQV